MTYANPDGDPEFSAMPEPRRVRIVRWLLEHNELDELATKGKLTFDLGRRPGGGAPAVGVVFQPHAVAEEL